MSWLSPVTSLFGGENSPSPDLTSNYPGLGGVDEYSAPADNCDPNDACCHWYDYLTLGCLGQQVGTGISKATQPITTEINTVLVIIVAAIIIIVALILFGKNTGALASHLRVG